MEYVYCWTLLEVMSNCCTTLSHYTSKNIHVMSYKPSRSSGVYGSFLFDSNPSLQTCDTKVGDTGSWIYHPQMGYIMVKWDESDPFRAIPTMVPHKPDRDTNPKPPKSRPKPSEFSYKPSLSSGVYGSYRIHSNRPVVIPLIMNNIGNRPIIPVSSHPGVPLIITQRNYPIIPVDIDVTPIVNTKKILKIASRHNTISSAINELAKKLPFPRQTNYIIAKQMLFALLQDNPIQIHDDISTNETGTPLIGIDDLIASFSPNTMQTLGTVGETKQPHFSYDHTVKTKRKPFVGGNWKCNGTLKSVHALAEGLAEINTLGIDVLVAPLAIHIPMVQSKLSKSKIIISSQNVSATNTGAFTGEIACAQLMDFGVNTALIGHSERRKYYGETNDIISKKVVIALENKLDIVCCLGETLDERKANKVEEVCFASLQAIANGVGKNGWDKVVIAYEPV
eukprot:668621_1